MKHSCENAKEIIDGFEVATWQKLENGRLLCTACPRACTLKDGQRGLCFVRARKGDTMVLTTMNRSSGFCIDPIEKKPLNHFLPGTPILSFGTAGCNLACSYCQNWSISTSRSVDTLADEATGDAIAKAAIEKNCRSIAFTYNDPVIFAEYAIEAAHSAHAHGLKAVAVSAGYIEGKPREDLFSVMDAANIDLKSFNPDTYTKICKGELEIVKDTLKWLVHESNVWVEITTLLIPGLNDSTREITQLCEWVYEALGAHIPIHFSAFRPEHRMLDRPPTPHATLARARHIALQTGLHYAYIGNIPDTGRQTTWCPSCEAKLIERTGYTLSHYALNESGQCLSCSQQIHGVFEKSHGTWGAKREPVSLKTLIVNEEPILPFEKQKI